MLSALQLAMQNRDQARESLRLAEAAFQQTKLTEEMVAQEVHKQRQPLDSAGRHATLCCKAQQMQRHHAVRDTLARLARWACMPWFEQRLGAEIRADRDLQPLMDVEGEGRLDDPCRADPLHPVEDARPIRTADVQIFQNDGSAVYLDVRVTTCPEKYALPDRLKRQENQKRAEYGLPPCPSEEPRDGLRLFEQAGRLGPVAVALCAWLQRARAQHLRQFSGASWSSAERQSWHDTWAPLSCALLRQQYLAWALCVRETSSAAGGPARPPE